MGWGGALACPAGGPSTALCSELPIPGGPFLLTPPPTDSSLRCHRCPTGQAHLSPQLWAGLSRHGLGSAWVGPRVTPAGFVTPGPYLYSSLRAGLAGRGRGHCPLLVVPVPTTRPHQHTHISGPGKSGEPPQGENIQKRPGPRPGPPRPTASFPSALCLPGPPGGTADTRLGRSPPFCSPSSSATLFILWLKNKPTQTPF